MNNLAPTIDRLGALLAQIANLEAEEKAIKQELIALGAGSYDGDVFSVTVSMPIRGTLDMKAVRAKLSQQFITAHTTDKVVPTVRVVSR